MQERNAKYWVAGMIALFTLLFSVVTIERFLRLKSTLFDLGIFDQAVFLLSHGKDQFLTSRGVYIQEDHFHPILFLVAPIYWLWSSPKALLVLQCFVVGLGALPAYKIARLHGLKFRYSLLLVAAYLCQPAVTFLTCWDFHPVSLMMTFLVFALWGLEAGKPVLYVIALLLSMMCTEAAGFTIAFLAFNAAYLRGVRWGVGTAALAVCGLALSKLNAARYDAPSPYSALYFQYGSNEKEIVWHLLTHPFEVVSGLLTIPNFLFLFYLLSPLAFLSLAGPSRLWPMLPALAGNLLSWRSAQHRIEFQYSVALVPFLFWAAVVGSKRLQRSEKIPQGPVVGLLCLGISLSLFFGPLGAKHLGRYGPRGQIQAGQSLVKPEHSVSAGNDIGSSFSQREQLFLFPNPLVPMAWTNTPEALVHQGANEYPPLLRGPLRRGVEQTFVDWFVFKQTGRGFPLRRADFAFARSELARFPFLERLDKDDLLLFRSANDGARKAELAWMDVRPSLSEDGTLVAFEVGRKALGMSPPRSFTRWDPKGSELVVVDLVEEKVVRRLSASGRLRDPELSGDGQWLAYSGKSSESPHSDIYRTPTRGETVEAVDAPYREGGRGNCYHPALSRDGGLLAFGAYRPGIASRLWSSTPAVIHPSGSVLTYSGAQIHSPVSLSPEGSNKAWEERRFLAGRATSEVKLIQGDSPPRTISGGGEPAVSERHCVYTALDDKGTSQLFLFDLSSQQSRALTEGNDDSLEPCLSGDGRFLVFSSYADNLVEGDDNQQCDVFLLHLDTQELTRITDGDGPSYNPVVSVGGETIVFASLATDLGQAPQPAGQFYQWRRSQERSQVIPAW